MTAKGEIAHQDPLDRYRRLVEQSGVGLFETAVDGRVLWVNPAAARIVGYDTAEEFMASVKNIRSLYVHPHLRDEFVRQVKDRGSVTSFDYEIWHASGAIRWISVTSRPRTGDGGELIGFEGTVIDVTESKLVEAAAAAVASDLQPQEAVAGFARVLERVVPFRQTSLTAIEGDRYRRLVSIAGRDGAPLPPGELVPLEGNSVGWVVGSKQHLVVPDTSEQRWPFDRELAAVGVASYAIFPLIADGEVFATFNIGMPRPGDLSEDIVGLLSAITGSVAQGIRNILLYEREHAAVKRLEALDELKNDLIASVAHDLKTPLALVSGFTTVLQDNAGDLTSDERARAVEGIARNVNRMARLIRRHLNVALIEAEQMTYYIRSFDVATFLRENVEDPALFKETHVLELVLPPEKLVARGDPERNIQVLDNLVTNAMKFSPAGSRIEVGARALEDRVEVWVADEGPGIAEEDIPRLFKKMGRLKQEGEGTGLGLYICKTLVEGQGGTISVGRSASGGARFAYTLPKA